MNTYSEVYNRPDLKIEPYLDLSQHEIIRKIRGNLNLDLPHQIGLELDVVREYRGSCKVYHIKINEQDYILKIDKVDVKKLTKTQKEELESRKLELVSMFGPDYQKSFEPRSRFGTEFGEKFAKIYYSPPTGHVQLESRLLQALEEVPRIPRLVLDIGACWGDCSHYAIIKEYIPGRELMVHEQESLEYKDLIKEIMTNFDKKRVIARDFKPRNFVRTPQREIYFIDLDLCKFKFFN